MPTDAQRRNLASAHSSEVKALNERIALLEQQLAEKTLILDVSCNHYAIVELRKKAQWYDLIRRGQHWSVIDGIGNVLRGDDLDAAITRTQEQT